jgi:hypothetical protein
VFPVRIYKLVVREPNQGHTARISCAARMARSQPEVAAWGEEPNQGHTARISCAARMARSQPEVAAGDQEPNQVHTGRSR